MRVRDTLGNTASGSVIVSNIDRIAPTVTINYSTAWAKSFVLSVVATDDGSGLHATAYSYEDGTTWVASNT